METQIENETDTTNHSFLLMFHLIPFSITCDGAASKVVKSVPVNNSGYVLLDWLRPAPLSDEKLSCVCEVGDASWPAILEEALLWGSIVSLHE